MKICLNLSLLVLLLISMICLSCESKQNAPSKSITDAFYQTYKERKDFEKFIDFYDEQIVLEDMINGDRMEGKKALRTFFDWENPNFECLSAHTLEIEEKIIQANQAVVKGYFSAFRWGTTQFEAMHFTTILTFNEAGKIVKQVDWINYPATLVAYSQRKNSNEWIK